MCCGDVVIIIILRILGFEQTIAAGDEMHAFLNAIYICIYIYIACVCVCPVFLFV